MPDEATCRASRSVQSTVLATAPAAIAAGRMHYDAAAAGACIASLDGLTCSNTALTDLILNEAADPCAHIFTGALPSGSACLFDEECAGGGLCQKDGTVCSLQCCPGTCAVKPATLALGADCTTPLAGQTCAHGSFCAPRPAGAPGRICAPQSTTAGAACAGFDSCASPLFCMGETPSTATCAPLGSRGAACNPGLSTSCDDARDYCEPTTLVCTARHELGSACSVDVLSCRKDAFCDPTAHVCAAQLTAGQPCGGSLIVPCLGDLQCESGSCALPPPAASCL